MATFDCSSDDRIRICCEDGEILTVSAADVIQAIKRVAPTPKAIELAELVAEMRRSQNSYFKNRDTYSLEASRTKERIVDQACRQILDGQKKLF